MAGRGRPKKKVEVPETVQELIQRVEPELIEADGEHSVACHLYNKK